MYSVGSNVTCVAFGALVGEILYRGKVQLVPHLSICWLQGLKKGGNISKFLLFMLLLNTVHSAVPLGSMMFLFFFLTYRLKGLGGWEG